MFCRRCLRRLSARVTSDRLPAGRRQSPSIWPLPTAHLPSFPPLHLCPQVVNLILAVEELKRQCDVPVSPHTPYLPGPHELPWRPASAAACALADLRRPPACPPACLQLPVLRVPGRISLALHRSPGTPLRPLGSTEQRRAACLFLRHLQPTLKEIIGAEKEAEYFAALDEMAENAFDDQVGAWVCAASSVAVRQTLNPNMQAWHGMAWRHGVRRRHAREAWHAHLCRERAPGH